MIASDRARFIEIFSKRGLSVDFGGSWLLPRLVGLHRAKELVFLADVIDAAEAERIGLVNRVVPHDELARRRRRELARELAALPPIQLSVSKRLLNQSLSVSMADALEFEDIAQVMNFQSADTAEAIAGLRAEARADVHRALSAGRVGPAWPAAPRRSGPSASALAARTASQSGAVTRSTSELCASHSAPQRCR